MNCGRQRPISRSLFIALAAVALAWSTAAAEVASIAWKNCGTSADLLQVEQWHVVRREK